MRRALPLLIALTGAGCFYPADRGRALEARVDALVAENAEQQQKVSAALPRIDEKVGEVEKALEGLDKAARRGDADMGVQLQKTIEDVAQLRGQVESYLFKINELETQLKTQTDARATAAADPETTRAVEAKKRADELRRPEDKGDFLALADEKAKGGDVALGRQLYAEFLRKWPKDALSGDAHFGLGETYFGEEKCREALFEYGKVIKDFDRSKSAPNAYVRSSECFRKLKMNDESRLALEEVVKQYPKSDASKTARARLAELDKKKPASGSKKR